LACAFLFFSKKRQYDYLVRVKISLTLPAELLARLDRVDKNRSALFERAAAALLAGHDRKERNRKDLEIINRRATRLNNDATDVLDYQRSF
jgi:metal-responsive CopG/Arc/MetJ family transcriptional regulator